MQATIESKMQNAKSKNSSNLVFSVASVRYVVLTHETLEQLSWIRYKGTLLQVEKQEKKAKSKKQKAKSKSKNAESQKAETESKCSN